VEAVDHGLAELSSVLCCDRVGEIAAFLDEAFDGAPGIAAEFPLLVGANEHERRLVIRARGRLVAHAAWRPLELCSGERRLRAAGIGLVTTHPAWRGQGLATRVVAACLPAAAAAGCGVALLFAESRGLYARLGFAPVGRERRTRLERRGAADPRVRELRAPDAARLLELLAAQRFRVERDPREQARLLAIPGTRCFALESAGELAAYCVLGKGRDLAGVIHEWAGAPEAVRALVESVAAREGPLRVLSPGWGEPPVCGDHETVALAQGLALAPGPSARELLGDATARATFPTYVWGLDSF
jgi:predicted N-acetyltransferase YhbS